MGLDRRNWRKPYTEDELKSMLAAGEMLQLRQRVQELEKELEDFESDIDTCTQHNVELQLEVIKLTAERDHWKHTAQNNHDRLVDVQAERDALQFSWAGCSQQLKDACADLDAVEAERDELLAALEYAYTRFDDPVDTRLIGEVIDSVKEKS